MNTMWQRYLKQYITRSLLLQTIQPLNVSTYLVKIVQTLPHSPVDREKIQSELEKTKGSIDTLACQPTLLWNVKS